MLCFYPLNPYKSTFVPYVQKVCLWGRMILCIFALSNDKGTQKHLL